MPPKHEKKDVEAEVWNAISAFEQILEAMPNDKASLEALSHAYQQIGDHTKAKEYFVRLGNILVEEGEVETAKDVVEKIRKYAKEDSSTAALVKRMDEMLASKKTEAAATASVAKPKDKGDEKKPAEQVRTTFDMAEELAFAWNLLEAKELTQEEYSSVVQDLTEMSAGDSVATISLLHVLEARHFKNLEKIMAFVAKECDTPYISLPNFDLQLTTTASMPHEVMVRRGTLVFEFIGKDALVVVMNPYDKQLRKDVEAIVGRRCHFFITLPSEFDKAVQKVADGLAEKAAQEKNEEKK